MLVDGVQVFVEAVRAVNVPGETVISFLSSPELKVMTISLRTCPVGTVTVKEFPP